MFLSLSCTRAPSLSQLFCLFLSFLLSTCACVVKYIKNAIFNDFLYEQQWKNSFLTHTDTSFSHCLYVKYKNILAATFEPISNTFTIASQHRLLESNIRVCILALSLSLFLVAFYVLVLAVSALRGYVSIVTVPCDSVVISYTPQTDG